MTALHPDPQTEPVPVRDAIGKDGWIEFRHDYRKGATSWHRMVFDRPGPAMRATLSDWRWNIGGEDRRFTESELKAVAGFPGAFTFAPGMVQIWRRIGNSVPPLMMMAIARHIRSEILRGIAPDS